MLGIAGEELRRNILVVSEKSGDAAQQGTTPRAREPRGPDGSSLVVLEIRMWVKGRRLGVSDFYKTFAVSGK
jgi:hypothetical protein